MTMENIGSILIFGAGFYMYVYSIMILAWFFPAYKFMVPFYWRTGKSKRRFATDLKKRSYYSSPLQYKHDKKTDTLYFHKRPPGRLRGPVLSLFGRVVKNDDGTVTFYGGLNPFFVFMIPFLGTILFQGSEFDGLWVLAVLILSGVLVWHGYAYKQLAEKHVSTL